MRALIPIPVPCLQGPPGL
uniref:Uncharacterized protein n=1 Tax=Anguilla anguilla TaxID=7936 RepID=A0A0E9S713_ANGAN